MNIFSDDISKALKTPNDQGFGNGSPRQTSKMTDSFRQIGSS
jgi:alanine-alpha-ketoisovalerate/valine-pyruvate aminotransferase